MSTGHESRLADALREARAVEIVFEEESLRLHGDDRSVKVGFRPVRLRGIPFQRPPLVTYVRATDARGNYWYVMDWTRNGATGLHEEILAESEQGAKDLVLTRLRAAAAAGLL